MTTVQKELAELKEMVRALTEEQRERLGKLEQRVDEIGSQLTIGRIARQLAYSSISSLQQAAKSAGIKRGDIARWVREVRKELFGGEGNRRP